MKIQYFKFMDHVWAKLSQTELTPSDRVVLLAIIQVWNKNFYHDIEFDKDVIQNISGVKSKRKLLDSINTLETLGFIAFFRSKSRHVSSKISVLIDPVFTEAKNDTVNGFTEAKNDTVNEKYIIHKDLYIKTNIKTVAHENEKVKITKKKTKVSKVENVCFLDSEIGTPQAFKNYVESSEHPEADPDFYFASIRDWLDRKTGKPAKRKNWKLVFNQFARNDIQRYGTVKLNNGKISSQFSGRYNSGADLQNEYADIDEKLAKFIAIRNS